MSKGTKCGKCKDDLPSDEEFATCRLCEEGFHFETCSMKLSSWKGLGKPGQGRWACPSCRNKEKSPSVTEEDSTLSDGVAAKLDSLLLMKKSIEEIEKSMQFQSSKYDDILQELKDLRAENKELREELKTARKKQVASDNTIKDLEERLNELDQYGRRVNLEIHGVPVSDEGEENTENVIKELAKEIGVCYVPQDVHKVHRLQKKKDSNPPAIIVQFHSSCKRDEWLIAGKKARLTSRKTGKKIFFNENLTRVYRSLHWETKERCKTYNYKFVWFSRGKLKAKRDENDRNVIVIRNRDDINKIGE